MSDQRWPSIATATDHGHYHAPTELPGAEPDGRVGVHRAGDRAGPEGRRARTSSSWRSATARSRARRNAKRAGIRAIEENETGYCPSLGLPDFRAAAARFVSAEFGYAATAENIVVGSGAKPFEQFFAEAVLDPGDGVLVFSPQFPTYVPNLERRGARAVLAPLKVENEFRPSAEDVEHFLATDPQAPGDLPQLAAQPDRRRGDPRGPGRDRRRGARHRADGLLRRAVLPHGLERPARVDPGRAGDARAHGGGLHVQQVVQHERLADRLRGGVRRPWSMRSAS